MEGTRFIYSLQEVVALLLTLNVIVKCVADISGDESHDTFSRSLSAGTEDIALNAPADDTTRFEIDSTSQTYGFAVNEVFLTESTRSTHRGSMSTGNITLSTTDIELCLKGGHWLNISALTGVIFYQDAMGGNNSDEDLRVRRKCKMQIAVPQDCIIQIILLKVTCDVGSLLVYDSPNLPPFVNPCAVSTPTSKTSFTSTVILEVMTNLTDHFNFLLHFQSVTRLSTPNLELNMTSATQGYVQTPNWNGENMYPILMDSWVRINVPENHAVLVSIMRLDLEDCNYDSLSLYLEGYSQDNFVWKVCRRFPPRPDLYHASVLFLHFISDESFSMTGFRLLFSFHNLTALPERLLGGNSNKWNCSVPHWMDFQQHVSCNLQVECIDGKDEVDCPYTSATCGPGFLSAGGSCFFYVTTTKQLTWNDASNVCLLRGARLASLNTLEKFRDINRFLLLRQLENAVYIGLKSAAPTLPHVYKWAWQWSDSTVAYTLNFTKQKVAPLCATLILSRSKNYTLSHIKTLVEVDTLLCDYLKIAHVLCEVTSLGTPSLHTNVPAPSLLKVNFSSSNILHVLCPSGHVTHALFACDARSECWEQDDNICANSPTFYLCSNGLERVPFTLLCNHHSDCSDSSDESFCFFPPCNISLPFQCSDNQCITQNERCDGLEQCGNGADEMQCSNVKLIKVTAFPPPAVIDLDGRGDYTVRFLETQNLNSTPAGNICPETHFLCPSSNYCMPVYMRCNSVYDCPDREDETACDSYRCPGFYRCRDSRVCVHSKHVCDGVFQCPQHDDEFVCNLVCPESCACYGLAFLCTRYFSPHNYPDLRYVDAHNTGMAPSDFQKNIFLVHLNLAGCGLNELIKLSLPNLLTLDLSYNLLTSMGVDHLRHVPNLQTLFLKGNPIMNIFQTDSDFSHIFPNLLTLDMADITILNLNSSIFTFFPELQTLNLSGCGVDKLSGDVFQSMPRHLHTLDIRGCPMTEFPPNVFKELQELEFIRADNFKLCCPAVLPDEFVVTNCHAPGDEISSCDDLLKTNTYRGFLFVFAVLALLGNAGSFVYRVFILNSTKKHSFGIFVTHLCLSDFLMGVYLSVIGIADLWYRGTYLWQDLAWKNSSICKVAGFLSLLSWEVSVIIVCLITIDRFLALHFPFSQLHFQKWSSHLACGVTWVVGSVLAFVPLLPMTSHWQFYSQTGICIPLPFARSLFPGHVYSFAVIIVFNFILFLMVAVGQIVIYWSIRVNSLALADRSQKSKDLTVARRLFTVVMSNFLCWFPIGLLGIMASSGIPLPGEVNVAIAIFALPLNASLNPFLYTLNMIRERRRRVQEERRQKRIMSQLQTQQTKVNVNENLNVKSVNSDEAWEIIRSWLTEGVVSQHLIQCRLKELTKDTEKVCKAENYC